MRETNAHLAELGAVARTLNEEIKQRLAAKKPPIPIIWKMESLLGPRSSEATSANQETIAMRM